MNIAQATFVIIGGVAAALTVIGSYTWWVYRRGQESGRVSAEHAADKRAQAEVAEKLRMLETQLDATKARLDSLLLKRRRT
jgi:hypothetical protein